MNSFSMPKVNVFIVQVNRIQGVSVPGDLCLVLVQRRAILIDNGGNTLIAGHNALDGVGAFDGLHFRDGFKLREDLRVFLFAHTCHGFQFGDIFSEVHKACRKHP